MFSVLGEFAFHLSSFPVVPQRERHSDLRISECSPCLPSLRSSWTNGCVGGQEKNRICCLVRANYPDNWLKFLSSVAGVEPVFGQESVNPCSGGGKHLPPAPQTLRGTTSCKDSGTWLRLQSPRLEIGTEGQRCRGNPPPAKATTKASTLASGWAPPDGRLWSQLQG